MYTPQFELNLSLFHTYISSPCGPLEAVASKTHLYYLGFKDHKSRSFHFKRLENRFGKFVSELVDPLVILKLQLDDYFKGITHSFDATFANSRQHSGASKTLMLDPQGTAFQLKVWHHLCQVPYGKTTSYSNLAGVAGNPKAFRAVASANARNPISIIVPCHRVIGQNGKLAGYAGGLDNKAWLLAHESPKDRA